MKYITTETIPAQIVNKIIKPSEVYKGAKQQDLKRILADYDIVEFRPPLTGEFFLMTGFHATPEVNNVSIYPDQYYGKGEPRFILKERINPWE